MKNVKKPATSKPRDLLNPGHMADVYHAGTNAYYKACILQLLTKKNLRAEGKATGKGQPLRKQFLYCESAEGGMDDSLFDESGPTNLLGWMKGSCISKDTALMEWVGSAKIGDYYHHRMGVAIRLRDV